MSLVARSVIFQSPITSSINKVLGKVRKEFIFMQCIVECGPWGVGGRWGAHISASLLLSGSVTKGEDVVFHDECKCLHQCLHRYAREAFLVKVSSNE